MPNTRKIAALLLITMLAGGPAYSAPSATMLVASVSSAGQPLAGVQMRVISLDTGRAVLAATTSAGVLSAALTPGLYTVNAAGYEQVAGPRVVSVAAGEVASAALAFSTTEPQPAPTPTPTPRSRRKTAGLILGGAVVAGGIIYFATKGPSSPSK